MSTLRYSDSLEAKNITPTLLERNEFTDLSIKNIKLDEKEHKDVFFDLISGELISLFDHKKCLQKCVALQTPIYTVDSLEKDSVTTYQCESKSDIISITNKLKQNELAFIIYRRKWGWEDMKASLTFTLLSNQGSNNELTASCIVNEKFSGNSENVEFFGIKFDLYFDQEQKLSGVTLLRGVNPNWRRKKICTQVSLNCLEQLFNNHLYDEPKLNFTAIHIATVKFCYPLNPFYHKETKEHLRDTDPEQSDLKLSEIIRHKGSEDYSDFSYNGKTTNAYCPHKCISLRQFLLQHKLRRILDQV